MVLPPYYLKTDGDGLLHYFEEIARGRRTSRSWCRMLR